MVKQINLFSIKSLEVSGKSIISEIITFLAGLPIYFISKFLQFKNMVGLYLIFVFISILWGLYFFGWISNKLWGWK